MKDYIMDNSIAARKAEIDIKVNRLTEAMKKEGLSAIYINRSNNYAWITAGGDNIITRYSEDGVIGILITVEGKRYAISNTIEEPRMIDEEMLPELGFELRISSWYENKTLEFIYEIIGKGADWAADFTIANAKSANAIIAKAQYSLLDSEIARYIYMGHTFSKVLEEVLATVKVGDTELSVIAKVQNALTPLGIEAVLYLSAADERIYKYRHCIPTEKKIEKLYMISCNARYKGLVTKTTRFVSFGEPTADFVKQYEDTIEIENRMALATKAGVDDLVPHNLAKELYAQKGYPEMWKVHHQGGPQGYTNGYYLVTEDNHGIIQPNQCYCYNPSITGTKTEDGFIVTEEGPLFITIPVSFPVIKTTIDGVTFERPGILVIE